MLLHFAARRNVARVDFATGNVTAVTPDGRSRPLSKGSEIDVGETVATQQGRAQLRFSDGAYMSLQPRTEFKVEEFKYSGKGKPDEGDSIVMNLLKGGLRTITGLIGRANRDGYRLRTDVATIGIRGTEYSVKYTNSIEVFCADGSILVQNEGGTLQLNGGQGGYVASNQTPPQQTENRPVLPPEGPADQELQQQQEQPADPVNPIQEANPPVTQTILTGKLALHTAFAGYDRCGDACFTAVPFLDSTAELDGSGNLIAFSDPRPRGETPSGVTTVGSATNADNGNDGVIACGRWTNGVLGGDGYIGGSFSADLSNNGGSLHYIVGTPTPSADISALQGARSTATYSFLGGTSPMDTSGNIGSLTGGQLIANFGTMSVDMTLNVSIASKSYAINGSGMSITGSGFSGSGLATTGCPNGCSTLVEGFFAGANAARAGVAYHIEDNRTSLDDVFGTAAFIKQ